MITLGIDLASRSERTALAQIAWGEHEAELVRLVRGASDGLPLDDKLLMVSMLGQMDDVETPSKVAIDAPFGWPEPFVDALVAHHQGIGWPSGIGEPRSEFERRATDRHVHARTGKLPLSVSTDRIAFCAMRCAALLAEIGRGRGQDAVTRDGASLVAEVYPDPALRLWLPKLWADAAPGTYKGKTDAARERREAIMRGIYEHTENRLAISLDHREACVDSDDCLDALICAMLARAVALGQTEWPADGEAASLAAVEGWIHLPTGTLRDLFV